MKKIILVLVFLIVLFTLAGLVEAEEIEKDISFQIGEFDSKDDEDITAIIIRQDSYFSENIYNEFTLSYMDTDSDVADGKTYSVDWVFYAPLLKNRGLMENNVFLGAGINYSHKKGDMELYLPPPYDINIVFDGDFNEYTLPISAVARAKIREGTFLRVRADYILIGKYSGDIDLEVGSSVGINSALEPSGDIDGYSFDISLRQKINEKVSFVIGYMDKHFTYEEDEGLDDDSDNDYDGFYLGCDVTF